MSRYSTFPTLYDEVLQISITKLKQWEYLNPNQFKSGTITWSNDGEETASISISLNTQITQPYIELNYKSNDEPRKYKVRLVSIPSNLGIGKIWYFLCPQTHKRCRKLYLVGGYFLHREAFKGCMYDSQTKSKSWRQMVNVCGGYFELERLYEEKYSKHFKKHYNGKPTKRYLKLMRKINKGERIPISEIKTL